MANSYLTKTNSSTGSTTKATISMWVKFSNISTAQALWENYGGSGNYFRIRYESDSTLVIQTDVSNSTDVQKKTNRKFRDPNAWYHIVVAINLSDSTQEDKYILYVNGVRETSFATNNNTANTSGNYVGGGNGFDFTIGRHPSDDAYFQGYISHYSFVDGANLTPTSFGAADSTTGQWKFKSPTGVTWGTNGFHLKFENSGALGTDSSGNTNTFTVNGNLKQALDTPSNVYCNVNPLDNYAYVDSTLTNGNTTVATASGSPSWNYITSTLGVSTGKWYWEVKDTTNNSPIIGFAAKVSTAAGDQLGESSAQWGVQPNGRFRSAGSDLAGVGTFSYGQNDIVGIALDATNKKVYFHTNGTYGNSGNPSTGANGITIASPDVGGGFGFYFPAFGDGNTTSDTFHVNWGNGFFGTTAITSAGSNGNGSLFEYDVPSGYYALNTKNLNTYG